MGKGKVYVKEYEANANHIRNNYEYLAAGELRIEKRSNTTPKKKKRK